MNGIEGIQSEGILTQAEAKQLGLGRSRYYELKKKGVDIREHIRKKAERNAKKVDKAAKKAERHRFKVPIDESLLEEIKGLTYGFFPEAGRDECVQKTTIRFAQNPIPKDVSRNKYIMQCARSVRSHWLRKQKSEENKFPNNSVLCKTAKLIRQGGVTKEIEHQSTWKRTIHSKGSKKNAFKYRHRFLNGYRGAISNFSKSTPIAFVEPDDQEFKRGAIVHFGKSITGTF